MSMPLAAVQDDRCRDKGSRASPRLADTRARTNAGFEPPFASAALLGRSEHRLQPRSTLRTELHRAAGSGFKPAVSASPSRPPTRMREPYPIF